MEFVAELYVPRGDAGAAARLTELARRAEGTGVRFVRSIFMPEDETCFLLYEAESADAVRSATSRASLPVERVVLSERIRTHHDEGGTR
jgi:hypothetical protein